MKNPRLIHLFVIIGSFFCGNLFGKNVQINLPKISLNQKVVTNKKSWTIIVYIAGDNDLFEYALRDLQEMARVGSNEHLNIVAQLDGYGIHEKTKRLFIDRNTVYEIEGAVSEEKLDSGATKTLVDCFKWAMENFKADHYALVLWNHGSGILDPMRGKAFRQADLFVRNPLTNLLEIDRSTGFIDLLRRRGICFSDTYGTYLTHEKLDAALSEITALRRKKIDVIAFDACLMAMIEVADIARYYADYMIASEEVEPGDGWWYKELLEPLSQGYITPYEFAKHAVESYRVGYLSETREFTQSALQLRKAHVLIDNIDRMSTILMRALDFQLENTLSVAVEIAKDSRFCTTFAEPSYIDLHNFYSNLRMLLPFVRLEEGHTTLLDQLERTLESGIKLIESCVIANVCGADLSRARGISIYFPSKSIDISYEKTYFFKENAWAEVIRYFTQ